MNDYRLRVASVFGLHQIAAKIAKDSIEEWVEKDPDNPDRPDNPPAWVKDKPKWEKAKKQVEPYWKNYDEPYAVVADVYEKMGGKKK